MQGRDVHLSRSDEKSRARGGGAEIELRTIILSDEIEWTQAKCSGL